MWYFAYGSNLSRPAVSEWCRRHALRPPAMIGGKAAILDNYRLAFTLYSEYWGGGTADIVYDPGKYVAGVLFEVTEPEMLILDKKVERTLDSNGKEIGVYKRATVTASPLTKGAPIQAATYQGIHPDRFDIPPTQAYMDILIHGAYDYGLSMVWLAYLQSFATQAGRGPRGTG